MANKPVSLTRKVVGSSLLVFAASSFCLAQTGAWSRQKTGTLAWLHSIFFLDQNRGWAVGSRGAFLRTTDGGRNWQIGKSPTPDIIRDVYFANEQNGWLLCERNVYELKGKDEPRTYIMTTTTGGEHWDRVDLPGIDVNALLTRTLFSANGRAWTFGEGGSIFTSQDGLSNWTKLTVPTRHLLLGGIFIDEHRGWIVGAGSTILQTSDGGDTWHRSQLTAAPGVRFTAASFVDNRLGWTVGSDGTILRTTNGGRTWSNQSSGVDVDLLDVKFLDAQEGWAVGVEGTVVHTIDGGLHWQVERSETTHPLERIFFIDRSHGWAVGFGGTIVTYVRAEAPRLTGNSL